MSFFAQKQRGVFSEVLDPTLPSEYDVRNYNQGPTQEIIISTINKQQIPKAISLQRLQTSQASRVLSRQGLSSKQFSRAHLKKPEQQNITSVEPKVILPYDPIPGDVPRKVAIDRKRKEFRSLNFEQLLASEGISFQEKDATVEWLKLEYFDDTNYDDNANEDWINRQYDEEGIFHPLIGLGFREKEKIYEVVEIKEYKDDLFHGRWLRNNESVSLHRLFICFDAEDPRKYCKRLANAFKQRIYADAQVRYNYFIDNMSLFDLTELDNEQKKRIEAVAKTKKLENMETTQLMIEVNMDFQRTMNKIIFDKYLDTAIEDESYPKLRLPEKPPEKPVRQSGWIELEQVKNPKVKEIWMYKYNEVYAEQPKSFHELLKSFGFSTLYVSQEVAKALQDIRHECNVVLKENIFDFSDREGALHLDEFKHMQENATTSLMYQLKGTWVPTMIKIIKDRFAEIGKGWFNMKETSKMTYDFGKLKRMLTVIRLMMQDTITTLMKENFFKYQSNIYNNIPLKVDIKQTAWVLNHYNDGRTADNRNVTYDKHRKLPLFQIELLAKDDYFHYTTNPQLYIQIALHALKKALDEMSKIPDLEPKILSDLHKSQKLETYIKAPMMPLTEPVEPDVNERPRKFADENKWVWDTYYDLQATMEKALLPLQDFKEVFNQYIPVLKLRPDDVARDIELEDPPRDYESIKEEIYKARDKEIVLTEQIPEYIHVGMFEIHLNEAKGILIEKYQNLQKNLIDLISRRARSASIRIFQEFGDIKKTIQEEPPNIEKLTILKEYIDNIPGELEKMKLKTKQLEDVFKMLEEFNYRFPIDDFQRRWKIIGSPKDIKEMIEVRTNQLEKLKVQYADQAKVEQDDFKDQIDNLERTIQGFHHHQDLSKHKEMAEIVEYVLKQLSEFQEQAQKYNFQESLFDNEQTDYSKLNTMSREFKPYYDLWSSAYKFKSGIKEWLNDDFTQVDADEAEKIVEEGYKNIQQTLRYMNDKQITGVYKIALAVKQEIEEFRPKVPLLLALRKKGMTTRHWELVSKLMGQEQVINPEEQGFNFTEVLKMGMMDKIEQLVNIGETAGKEYQIEMMLDSMLEIWENIKFQCVVYKNTFILKGFDEIQVVLDEHIINTSAMVFSPFKKFFEERISEWDKSLKKIQDVLEEWAKFQQQWMYLQPIFDSQDIAKQLPTETKKFKTVDQTWRTTVNQAKVREKVLDVCTEDGLWERLHEANKTLELVQKELNNYLERKREKFARFYFLSNDELLEILSQTKEPTAVQPHLKKVFENIHSIEFDKDKKIHAMFSAEKEKVNFVKLVDPNRKNVEEWMNEVENMMRMSVRSALEKSIELYATTKRSQWVLQHPGQCVLNGSQVHWTKEVEEAIDTQNLNGYSQKLDEQLNDLVDLVRTKLSKQQTVTINALIVIDVHARDVVGKMVKENVNDKFAFEWISQLRYYWECQTMDKECWVKCVQTNFPYGYEYLGNTLRLVITPLTDKCYMTLMGALRLNLGGAPAGPAGTGKTESTKDLAKALAKQCVVFNCSDSMDFIMVGKFFKGLASAGAWACFDEFNRINIEVLSVIAQQLLVLFGEKAKGTSQCEFEGSIIKILPTFSVFITMNPGYAGRTELPDNLKALFRPVAMMVPDYAMIGEIMLYSFGFKLGRSLAQKMVATFKLSSEQLSSQDHYDYGMRAVRSVINAAGMLKTQLPDMNEEQLLLRALRDVNVPKFLKDDLPLFENIITDLFPGLERPVYDYGKLIPELTVQCEKFILREQFNPLQPVQAFIDKIQQLYDTIQVRHGLMLVGPTGGAKTSNHMVLAKAMTALGESNGFYKVHTHILNPKSITMGQLYGQFNDQTHEWTDGVLAYMVRESVKDTTTDRHWIMFDGPVDALWIESMNTVLDDNKKLCLNSGQILTLTPYMTMMFEVEDLAVASPATVSRCGMVYMEPKAMGIQPLQDSYIQRLPLNIRTKKKDIPTKLQKWLSQYVEDTLEFVKKHCREVIPTFSNNLVQSQHKIIDSFLSPYIESEIKKVSADELEQLNQQLERIFHYSLIWSLMATGDLESRAKLDKYHREQMVKYKATFEYPLPGTIFDFQFNLTPWSDMYASFDIDARLQYHEIMIPTTDSVRNLFLIKLLLTNNFNVLCPGPTGTGKSQNAYQLLITGMPEDFQYVAITFSAQTSANQTQDTIDSWIDKRRKGVRGPPVGKRQIIFVDDLNMPKKEEYGAQPPIELIRQILDHQGWYNRQDLQFVKLEGLVHLSAMGPPGGGRSNITARIVRHYNILAYTELDENVIKTIFNKISNFFFKKFSESILNIIPDIVNSVLEIYNSVRKDLLPTPSKSHYTFNLRDISKVFQGICSIMSKNCQEVIQLVQLWYHENMRVFHDRLICESDREYFKNLLSQHIKEFGLNQEEVLDQERIIFCDFLGNRDLDVRPYVKVNGDLGMFVAQMEELLDQYNKEGGKKQMKLVMFLDACEHITRISRILRQPGGNALLLGIGGSGRQSLSKLATYLQNYKLQQIEVLKNYNMRTWRDDVKRILMLAGVENKQVAFVFVDTQIINEQMLEDINGILNSGDVTNLYNEKDAEDITQACKAECVKKGLPPNRMNIFSVYLSRVRKNMHMVIAMSPIGEAFLTRLRMFPSLVNCCTIDWFTEWPEEALYGVGKGQLSEVAESLQLDIVNTKLIDMFKYMHKSVERLSEKYKSELRRINYVTPTSYLELLNLYISIVSWKRQELQQQITRLKNGLDKLQAANQAVEEMKIVLEKMQPELAQAQIETMKMMEDLKIEKDEADKTQKLVSLEEAEATEQAEKANQLAQEAQERVREANIQLEATMVKVKDLKKEHLVELKALLQSPPVAVQITLAGVVILCTDHIKNNGGEIITQAVQGQIGKKEENYQETARKYLLNDVSSLLKLLLGFDKDNINPNSIRKLEDKVVSHPKFNAADAAGGSQATGYLYGWCKCMYDYYKVYTETKPLREKLAEMNKIVQEKNAELAIKKAALAEVNAKIAELQRVFEEKKKQQEELQRKIKECEIKLERAQKLTEGLSDEKERWGQDVLDLTASGSLIPGNAIVAAGMVAYSGPFVSQYRQHMEQDWRDKLLEYNLQFSDGISMRKFLGDEVKIQAWNIFGLPKDDTSIENGIIIDKSRRWTLMIDPQSQANKYIKTMGKEREEGTDVVKQSDQNLMRTLELAIQFGKWVLVENVGLQLDPSLEPILLQQVVKQGSSCTIQIGDKNLQYNNNFRFFMTTTYPNPHYSPETSVKVTIINFAITPLGLEEQMLAQIVALENPNLENKKTEIVRKNAQDKRELVNIEDSILRSLSETKGDISEILMDETLINKLQNSKKFAAEINQRVKDSKITEAQIDEARESYRPVAFRASLLFFCIIDLSTIDPMYQYSLQWFINLFCMGVQNAPVSHQLEERLHNLNEFFTYSLYENVCRSLFEKHKLLFSFMLTFKILHAANKMGDQGWRYLLQGATGDIQIPLNPTEWISENVWAETYRSFYGMNEIKDFEGILDDFMTNSDKFKLIFDSPAPQDLEFAEPWNEKLDSFNRIILLKALRSDKVISAIEKWIVEKMDERFIIAPTFDLAKCYKDSNPNTPLIFVLSAGSDPIADLMKFAEEMNMTKRIESISLGQGQGPKAEKLVKDALGRGGWVLLMNCHLAVSWMNDLEKLNEELQDQGSKDFRLWLTSMPSKAFPTIVLQNGVKMTLEPPKGLRNNLLRTYNQLDDRILTDCKKPEDFKKLLFGFSLFHAIIQERRKFGAIGWNIPYEFTNEDLGVCRRQLKSLLDDYAQIPFKVINYLGAEINYGGRVTDFMDVRLITTILKIYICPEALKENHQFLHPSYYQQLPGEKQNYVEYIEKLPLNPEPEAFGLHSNAEITNAQNETRILLETLQSIQPRTAAGAGKQREDVIEELATYVQGKTPQEFDIETVQKTYYTDYHESMNTVLVQELIRYNRLLAIMTTTLINVKKALRGLIVMSEDMEKLANSLFDNQVPALWADKGFLSLKPLASWTQDLLDRVHFLSQWIEKGTPKVFWISGFFFPQAFITGMVQNYARKHFIAIDKLRYDFIVMDQTTHNQVTEKPEDGIYVYGIYMEGAKWDYKKHIITQPKQKELYSDLPLLWIQPYDPDSREENANPVKQTQKTYKYKCPLYKVVSRAGTLSTTGHSTNFVMMLDLPSREEEDIWIRAGTAGFLALRY